MAIYHCSVKIISRSSGRSSVGASAYRAGEKLYNAHDGMTHDYERKKGVVHSEILLCENAPKEYQDRETLWNAVEQIEKLKNSQLAREVELALPTELSTQEQINLVKNYVQDNFIKKGMCADIAIHDKKDGNPHAHIMLTMRSIDEQGNWKTKKTKEYILDKNGEKQYNPKTKTYKFNTVNTNNWNEKENIEIWRADWSNKLNQELEKKNISQRVDHRSFERQGIEKIPTQHLGTIAFQLEKRGIKTDRGNYNREVEKQNVQLEKLEQELKNLQEEIKELQLDVKKAITPQTPQEIAGLLFDTKNKFLELVEDIEKVESYTISIEQEKRSIIAGEKNLPKDYQVLVNLHQQIKSRADELEQLKAKKSIFKSYKNEIQAIQSDIENLQEQHNHAKKSFIDKWKIKPNKENVLNKINEFKNRMIELESMELPSVQVLEQAKNEIIWEYKTKYFLAEIREDLPKIKQELRELEISNTPTGIKKSLSMSFTKQELILTNKDRNKILKELEQKDPNKAKEIIEQLPKQEQHKEREQDKGFEMER